MAELLLWNSMAVRRRSASDTFQENGLGILKQYMEEKGHRVHLEDWAHADGYKSLAPVILLKLNRNIASALIYCRYSFPRLLLVMMSTVLQLMVRRTQERRMKKKLRDLARFTAKEKIPLVGVKVWYGEAFHWSEYFCRMIQCYSPETVIVAGGYHVSLYNEDFLRYSSFDLAVDGPGEEALSSLAELTDSVSSKKEILLKIRLGERPIPGLLYRDHDQIRMTPNCQADLSGKVYPHYPENNGKVGVHILMDSLGCPWNKCSFCVHNQFSPRYSPRNISNIIDEIKYMRNQGIGLFRFAGSDTTPDRGAAIGEAVLKEKLNIEYSIGCRGIQASQNENDFEALVGNFSILIESGLRGVFIGGETGHDEINRVIMNKGLRSRDLIYTIKAIREAERRTGKAISISLAFIYPTPLIDGVADEDVRQANLKLIEACSPDAVMITPPGPFKNSEWYNNRNKYGFTLGNDFIQEMMQYEYVLYKPLSLWPPLTISLQGRDFKSILRECQSFKKEVSQKLGIPVDLSDEHFLMIRAAGKFTPEGIEEFKKESLIDILSADYQYLDKMGQQVSAHSRKLAGSLLG